MSHKELIERLRAKPLDLDKKAAADLLENMDSHSAPEVRKLNQLPKLKKDLVTFCSLWRNDDSYTPPPNVQEYVGALVMAALMDSLT